MFGAKGRRNGVELNEKEMMGCEVRGGEGLVACEGYACGELLWRGVDDEMRCPSLHYLSVCRFLSCDDCSIIFDGYVDINSHCDGVYIASGGHMFIHGAEKM